MNSAMRNIIQTTSSTSDQWIFL